jgi:hypothetical protein
VRVFKQYIYGDDKKIYFRVTLVKMTPFARAGVTGKRPAKSGWSSYFGHFVRFLNSAFDLSFCEVFEVQIYSWWDTRTQVLFSEVSGLNKFN